MYLRLRILPFSLSFLIACTNFQELLPDPSLWEHCEHSYLERPSKLSSVNVHSIVVPAAGAERELASGEHLSEGQQFAVRVTVHAYVHLYVVQTHRGGASQLLHRTDSPLARADEFRIPAADAWITVPAL